VRQRQHAFDDAIAFGIEKIGRMAENLGTIAASPICEKSRLGTRSDEGIPALRPILRVKTLDNQWRD
jgi:hypothetical protein